MSSYRSYRPWNSSLSSYSTKSDLRSRFGSDGTSLSSTSTASSPKFSSITPSSYRPSYSSSSGTYRASRAPPASSTTTTTPSYTRTYSSLGRDKPKEDEKDKKESHVYTRNLSSLGRDKPKDDEKDKKETHSYTRAYTSLGREKPKEDLKKEPSPPKRTSASLSTRFGSTKDLSAETKSRLASTYASSPKKEEKGPPITFNTRYKVTTTRGRSRDPSPSVENVSSAPPQTALQRLTAARDRSREPSPASKTTSVYSRLSAARSRDPSPVSKSYTDSSHDTSLNRSYSSNISTPSKIAEPSKIARSYSSNTGTTRDKSDRTYTSNLTTSREKSRDPSPVSSIPRRSSISSITSSYPRSRDPSPVDSKYLTPYRITNGRERSRDPSPVDTKMLTLNKTKLRELSPITSFSPYRRPSREPSPVESLSKYGSTSSGFSAPAYSKVYQKTTTNASSASSLKSPPTTDISISYMTASEANSRPTRISYINRRSPKKEIVEPTPVSLIPIRQEQQSPKISIPAPAVIAVADEKQESESDDSEETETDDSITDDSTSSSEEEEEVKKPEPNIMIQVTTITRATSPTPTGSSCSRPRRMEIAKTVEKVRERPMQGPLMLDKTTQSDRMDDSTRYSRFGSTSLSPYLYMDSKYSPSPTSYSSRYSAGATSRYSRELSEPVSNAENVSDKSESSDRTSQKSDKLNFSLPKSKESSPVKSEQSKNLSLKSPSPLRALVNKEKLRSTSSKSKTPESSMSSPLKSESPARSTPSSPKVTNKDFRKSALNMGPTDRVRRSKSTSSDNSSPTVEKTRMQFQQIANGEKPKERSNERESSTESEVSTASIEMESQIEQTKNTIPSKEELISAKVEEAKSFLLKTLGRPPSNYMKSPSPLPESSKSECQSEIEKTTSEVTCSTNYPTQTCSETKLDLNFSNLQKSISGEKAWWMEDNDDATENDTIQDASVIENDATLSTDNTLNTIVNDSTMLVNGLADLTISPSNQLVPEPEIDNQKWSWMKDGPSLNEKFLKLERAQSGERPWWCQSESPENKMTSDNKATAHNAVSPAPTNMWEQETQADISELQRDDEIREIENSLQNAGLNSFPLEFDSIPAPLGDRASPEGVESMAHHNRKSSFDSISAVNSIQNYQKNQDFNARPKLFISRHTNIDDLLGGTSVFSPTALDRPYLEMITPDLVRIHDSNSPPKQILRAKTTVDADYQQPALAQKLDDAAIQVYKDGDFGAYLDLESSLAEQSEEIEGLNVSRKNSLVVRTQLSVRVHAIIEKLLTSEGRELRRALFSLKQIFQEDKDLVHGFVALGGLNCLVQIGNEADQNYQNYILRALGQVMLYVDGMNGVMQHGPTVQWLYTLIASKYRLVVKTALKLLLVFVEYCEGNCYLLVNAIRTVDNARGTLPWSNIMKLLKDYDNADTELLIYATSLINKTLSGLSDQDSFYDESDYLEQQGMESIVQRYLSRPGTDLDLLDQLQLYEAALRFEDGESNEVIRLPDHAVRKTLRYRSSDSTERRKSRRYSTGTAPQQIPIPPPVPPPIIPPAVPPLPLSYMLQQHQQTPDNDSSSSGGGDLNGFADCKIREGGAGVTPGLRRRRERAERQKTFQREQEAVVNGQQPPHESEDYDTEHEDKKLLLQLKREQTVKDLTQKLSNLPLSPQEEKPNRIVGDMSGLISKAKEELAKSKIKGDVKTNVENDLKKPEPKKSEIELHWEELMKNMDRELVLCDLNFTDLTEEDEGNVLQPRGLAGSSIPPPPPPSGIMQNGVGPIPPPSNLTPPSIRSNGCLNENLQNKSPENDINCLTTKKTKKTVKLFWKEVREDMIAPTVGRTIWDELPPAVVDTSKLEHLFESRAKDLLTKKQQELNKSKEIIVLDHKRSNAINIAMTKLPPPRAIKAAILKMDSTVVTREGIEKLLNMLPTDEERGKIQEAQMLSPEMPLGSAEQFLLTLSSISELSARLQLWAFKLDFENIEKEIAEPLMDLKQGVELLKTNLTFKCILSTLLSIGCFLNGQPVKGFQIEYLAKVPEVKDTVHKHSLLHHLCHMVMESSPNTTDLYSEIGPITRASKADFAELAHNIKYLETECKASWDRLKLISKHDTAPQLKQKLIDFLADCAERIIILDIVHRRVINRYHKFLLWLGVPLHRIAESRPNEFCRILSEFALEYRTTRERVHQQIEKKANHRERNKTRGKLIIDVAKLKNGTSTNNTGNNTKEESKKDAELRQLLGNTTTDGPDTGEINGTFTFRRRRPDAIRSPSVTNRDESLTDGDDEILESLVKTATKTATPRPVQRERKRTRNADRKSFKRSRTREGFAAQRSPSPV